MGELHVIGALIIQELAVRDSAAIAFSPFFANR